MPPSNSGRWKVFQNGQVLYGPSGAGQNLNDDLEKNIGDDLDQHLADVAGDGVITGLTVSAGAGASVNIAAGRGVAAGQRCVGAGVVTVGGLTPSSNGILIYFQAGTPYSALTTPPGWPLAAGFTLGALIAGQVLLAVVNTDAGGLPTLITDARVFVKPGAGRQNAGGAPTVVQANNNTGVIVLPGDAVTPDTANDQQVVLGDVQASQKQFYVSQGYYGIGVLGLWVQAGPTMTKIAGALVRGNYVRKSAVTRALEDTGVAQGDGVTPPVGAVGIALQTLGGSGLALVGLFGATSGSASGAAGSVAIGILEARSQFASSYGNL